MYDVGPACAYAFARLITESTRQFSSPLQMTLDTPGVDFATLYSSVMVEEKLAHSSSCRLGVSFFISLRY